MIDTVLRTSLEEKRIVTIMYEDDKGNITKRNIKVISIDGNRVKAYCYLRRKIRIFNRNHILAADFYREKKQA